jgi:hypothetical protein
MMDDELATEAQRVLAYARRDLSPTPRDADRILAATYAALAAEPPSTADSATAAARIARLKLIVTALSIAALSGSIGYVLGYRAARSGDASLQPIAAVAMSSKRLSPRASPMMTNDAGSTPVSELGVPAIEAATLPRAPAGPASTHSKKTATPSTSNSVEPSPPVDTVASLAAELRALRRVELALRENQPRLALTLLDELDRAVPDGKLSEERLAAFVVARCAIGLGSRGALLREFANSHPDSVYLGRVEQSCKP